MLLVSTMFIITCVLRGNADNAVTALKTTVELIAKEDWSETIPQLKVRLKRISILSWGGD